MNWVETKKYQFDVMDITTVVNVVAVILTICGCALVGTILFIAVCVFSIVWTILKVHRYNVLILNLGLLAFNIYFLVGQGRRKQDRRKCPFLYNEFIVNRLVVQGQTEMLEVCS